MANATKRLLELKDEIERATLDKAKAEGALKQNLQRLKEDFGCTTLEEAQKKLAKMIKEKEQLEEDIEEAVEELESNYTW